MQLSRVVEYVFFFVLLAGAGYMVWLLLSPFISALALALIIVVIFYPLYSLIEKRVYKNNSSLAAAITLIIVLAVVILPILLISLMFAKELIVFYQTLEVGQETSFAHQADNLELLIQDYIPGFELNLGEQIKEASVWVVTNIGSIFVGTVSTIFVIFISLIGAFFFFRDGKEFRRILIKVSPLPDNEDEIILSRLARAVRSVTTGVVLLSIIQGVLVAVGFTIFGIEHSVLWGAVAALLAMMPGIGTSVIMIPAILYLFFTGEMLDVVGLGVWTILMVVFIDNMLGPYLMSRGNNLHPFIILISVLGGISIFGALGFIVGPVIVSLFMVLLEIYNQYIVKEKKLNN